MLGGVSATIYSSHNPIAGDIVMCSIIQAAPRSSGNESSFPAGLLTLCHVKEKTRGRGSESGTCRF